MIVSPAKGDRLKLPKGVHLINGEEQLAFAPAKLGRSVNCRSRFESRPVVILKGGAELATMKGLKVSFHNFGLLYVPKTENRCRTSKPPRPHSPETSYESLGNSDPPWPSVSFMVL